MIDVNLLHRLQKFLHSVPIHRRVVHAWTGVSVFVRRSRFRGCRLRQHENHDHRPAQQFSNHGDRRILRFTKLTRPKNIYLSPHFWVTFCSNTCSILCFTIPIFPLYIYIYIYDDDTYTILQPDIKVISVSSG